MGPRGMGKRLGLIPQNRKTELIMHSNQYHLLQTRRFLPLFITQFLNAFNDNVFKTALVILITYKISAGSDAHNQMLATLAYGLFIIPFFLFSATAGQIADKFEKSQLIRIIKFSDIIFMLLGAYALINSSIVLLMTTLFLMGSQSSFFGPLKYAILPYHLESDELIGGNAFIEAGTFISILVGTILAGLIILLPHGTLYTAIAVLSVAIAGWLSSLFIPPTSRAHPHLIINKNFLLETWHIVKFARTHHEIFLAIMGISWSWMVGGTFVSQFPTFTKDILGAQNQIVTIFMSCFSIGIAMGSLTCNKILHGEVNAKYIPLAIFIMGIFMADLNFASQYFINLPHHQLLSVSQFLSYPSSWRIFADIILLSIAGGIYIVPLYALLQVRSPENHRARIIAANNIINALFMVFSALLIMALLELHFTLTKIFITLAILNTGVALYMTQLLPQPLKHYIKIWFAKSK
jgi:acyl-[acyl-carrier-protein]-phospholipid O-acyltransferase / long-chain-fatty-acid--[acyl-carrier-protein] ligase